MDGLGVTEAQPSSPAAEEIKHLALRITNLLTEDEEEMLAEHA